MICRLSIYSSLRKPVDTPLTFIANPEQTKSLSVRAYYMDDTAQFINRMSEDKSYMYLKARTYNDMISDFNNDNNSLSFMYSYNEPAFISDYNNEPKDYSNRSNNWFDDDY